MVVKQDPAGVAPHEGESGSRGHGGDADQERHFRDFIGFFGSLVGLVGFGLGILPASTVAEQFLVTIAAFALSCAITLAVRLVRWSRAAAWLAVSGAVGVVSLAALSVLAQQGAHSAGAAEGSSTSGAGSTIVQDTSSASNSGTSTSGSGQAMSPPLASVLPSQQPVYALGYKGAFKMPGDNCQYSNAAFASNVAFTQQSPKVTVGMPGGDIEISCDATQATLQFNEQVARVVGDPSPAQCAAAITTDPISGSVPFGQLQAGSEFCFVAGSASATGPLVLATVTAVSGSPTFATAWTATAWSMPSTS